MQAEIKGNLNMDDLNIDTFPIFCRLYLVQEITKSLPNTCPIQYCHVTRLINSISPVLYENLNTEIGKILLLNEIYSLFMEVEVKLSKDFLYNIVCYLSKYAYVIERDKKKEMEMMGWDLNKIEM